MEAWVIVCWMLHKPPSAENNWLSAVLHDEHLCRDKVQKMDQVVIDPASGGPNPMECTCKFTRESK